MRPRNRTDKIILHNSKSPWGSVEVIKHWHADPPPNGNGWEDIGYHLVIEGAYPTYSSYSHRTPDPLSNGRVKAGRKLSLRGSHCLGYNWRSIGVCLVGNSETITQKQRDVAALLCCLLLKSICAAPGREQFSGVYPPHKRVILGHRETRSGKLQGKICPEISVANFLVNVKTVYGYRETLLQKLFNLSDVYRGDWDAYQEALVDGINNLVGV